MSKYFSALLFLLCCAVCAGTPQTAVRVGVTSWIGWSFIHVAVEQGFFRDSGLQVEAKWYAEPEQINQAFRAGEVQFRFDFVASVVDEYLRGEDVVLLAETNWSNGGDKVIAKKGKDLGSQKGATVGLYRDSPALIYFLSVYLESQRLNLADYKLKVLPLDKLTTEFAEGRLDFALVFDPYTIDLVKKHNGIVKAYSSQFPGCMPEGLYTHRAAWQAMADADKLALMKGIVRACEWLRDDANWAKYREILNAKVFPDRPPFEDAELRAMLSFVKIHPAKVLEYRNKPDGGLSDYLADLRKFLLRNRKIERDRDLKPLVDTRVLIEALR